MIVPVSNSLLCREVKQDDVETLASGILVNAGAATSRRICRAEVVMLGEGVRSTILRQNFDAKSPFVVMFYEGTAHKVKDDLSLLSEDSILALESTE